MENKNRNNHQSNPNHSANNNKTPKNNELDCHDQKHQKPETHK